MTSDLLAQILTTNPPPFALIHRSDPVLSDRIEIIVGEVENAESLAAIDACKCPVSGGEGHELLVLVPYRQIAERGFACVNDGEPLVVMRVGDHESVALDECVTRIPLLSVVTTDGDFDVDDETYAATVRQIIRAEIGCGEGANFVLKRSYCATIANYSVRHALSIFRRLLECEAGAYWTFLFYTGDRTLIGATPERHLSMRSQKLVMNPISGTYRYPSTGATLPGVIDFLKDDKESEELCMVVDEELKMMARLCENGVRLVGPYLKEMANLAHTEYFLEGITSRDIGDLLRETMFAPTVVGSPLESACRVIRRYEPGGRGYYSGVIALVGRDQQGARSLDSAILIRTADIDRLGYMRIGVGATIVRSSRSESEAAETRAKASSLLAALGTKQIRRYARHPDVARILAQRNQRMAGFWLEAHDIPDTVEPHLTGRNVLVVDAEDNFTSMLAHQLRALGLAVSVRRFDEPYKLDNYDLVVMGPGPGDPQDLSDSRIARLHADIRFLLESLRPFLAVCLSHQILSSILGLHIARRERPNQGVQREINLFGRCVRVGFYNTFSARCDRDTIVPIGHRSHVGVARDLDRSEVHALRGHSFRSVQFHPESILSLDGANILKTFIGELFEEQTHTAGSCTVVNTGSSKQASNSRRMSQ